MMIEERENFLMLIMRMMLMIRLIYGFVHRPVHGKGQAGEESVHEILGSNVKE